MLPEACIVYFEFIGWCGGCVAVYVCVWFLEDRLAAAGLGDFWWLFVLVALILLLLILLICCCFCLQRRKGDTYKGLFAR